MRCSRSGGSTGAACRADDHPICVPLLIDSRGHKTTTYSSLKSGYLKNFHIFQIDSIVGAGEFLDKSLYLASIRVEKVLDI